MARPVKGDVVVMPFPYSDLTQAKKRPALVLAVLELGDCILCAISTKDSVDRYAIDLRAGDFESGGIRQESIVRPNKLITAAPSTILYSAGKIKKPKFEQIRAAVIKILND